MIIHTKEKAKIHAHDPKGAKIKGSNIYTVEKGPKTIGAKVSDDKKKSYRKSTIHQSEPKNKGLSRFKRNYRASNTSIKTKNTNLHIAGRTGALAAGAVTEQMEGGQEVSQAAYLAYLPDSRSIAIHTLILHNAFIHILLLLRQWCSVYQINSCYFAHVPPPSLSKIPMWMYCVFFFCIDCRQNPVPVHESPLDTVKPKSSAYLIHR